MYNNLSQTPVSPKAFSDQSTIASLYGQANKGTFTRSVGMVDPLTGQSMDPTADQSTNTPTVVQPGSPMAPQPPAGVKTSITPNYDMI